MKRTIILLLINLFALAKSEILAGCPASPVMTDFDASRYVGKWYEIEKLSAGFEDNLKCIYAVYTPINGSFIQVQNNGLNTVSNTLSTINGYAYIPNKNTPNHLLVVLKVPIGTITIERTGKYDVWATDYQNYSLVYSCQLVPPTNRKVENVFILSRTKTLDPSTLKTLKNMLSSKGFDLTQLSVTTQDCNV